MFEGDYGVAVVDGVAVLVGVVVEAGDEGDVGVGFVFGGVGVPQVLVEVFPGDVFVGGDGVLVLYSVLVGDGNVLAGTGFGDAAHCGGCVGVVEPGPEVDVSDDDGPAAGVVVFGGHWPSERGGGGEVTGEPGGWYGYFAGAVALVGGGDGYWGGADPPGGGAYAVGGGGVAVGDGLLVCGDGGPVFELVFGGVFGGGCAVFVVCDGGAGLVAVGVR